MDGDIPVIQLDGNVHRAASGDSGCDGDSQGGLGGVCVLGDIHPGGFHHIVQVDGRCHLRRAAHGDDGCLRTGGYRFRSIPQEGVAVIGEHDGVAVRQVDDADLVRCSDGHERILLIL